MKSLPCAALVTLCIAAPAQAHFGVILPDRPIVELGESREIALTLGFGHPFAPSGLDLARPRVMIVMNSQGVTDLLPALQAAEFHGGTGFQLSHEVSRPGVQVFHMEPEPYFEPAENVFIVHYTKTYVPAFGDDSGWDTELGLPIEIVPLTRPFGLWAGNVFQGVVKRDGEPIGGADVEVEFYNADGAAKSPSEFMVTQTIRADENGVFTYAAPGPGWWGFAALATADERREFQGEPKDVEIGAVIWVHFEPWQGAQ